jgi:hypothetical protein
MNIIQKIYILRIFLLVQRAPPPSTPITIAPTRNRKTPNLNINNKNSVKMREKNEFIKIKKFINITHITIKENQLIFTCSVRVFIPYYLQ